MFWNFSLRTKSEAFSPVCVRDDTVGEVGGGRLRCVVRECCLRLLCAIKTGTIDRNHCGESMVCFRSLKGLKTGEFVTWIDKNGMEFIISKD